MSEIDKQDSGQEGITEELADISRSSKGLFKNRGFRLFSISQGASLLGDKLGYIALIAMVGALFPDSSSQVLATMSIVISLPTLLLGPIFMMLIDRLSRKMVLIISDVVRLVMTFGGPLLIMLIPNEVFPHYFIMLGFLLVYFTFTFTFNTARLAIIPDIVHDKDKLHGANSVLNFLNRISSMVGIPGGSFLVALAVWERVGIPGWSTAFFADGVTFIISVSALLSLRVKPHLAAHHHTLKETTDKITGGFRAAIDALKYIVKNPVVLAGIGSIIQFGVLNAVILVLMIPIVQTYLGLGTQGVGIMGLIVGAGFLVGTAGYGFFGKKLPKAQLIFICYAIAGLALGSVVILPYTSIPDGPIFWGYIFMGGVSFMGGLLYNTINTAHDTLIHEEVPSAIRGRIFSAREWLYNVSFMISSLILGASSFVADAYLLAGICGAFFILTSAGGMAYSWGRRGTFEAKRKAK